MTWIGAAAAAHHVEPREPSHQSLIVSSELTRVTNVELRRLVQFCMAFARRIGPHRANAMNPVAVGSDNIFEVRRVSAVDGEVRRISVGLRVNFLDCRSQ